MITEDDRRLLLSLARQTIVAHVTSDPAPRPSSTGVLAEMRGAFVTIHNHGELRGCIGHIEADQPLGQLIPRMAVAACSSDPRFPSVTVAELADLNLEVSLLGALEPIAGPDDIEIGRHGLVIEMGWHRGLLLPQVATEWKFDRETFLAHTCRKAGLAADAWLNGATAWRFEADVFSE